MYLVFYQSKEGKDNLIHMSSLSDAFSLIKSCFDQDDNIISLYYAEPLDTYKCEVSVCKVFHVIKDDDGKYIIMRY